MLTFSQMLIRLLAAIVLGGVMGFEREILGKEAGVRTSMLVSAGAALFTITGLELPAILAGPNATSLILQNSGYLGIIGNIVIGVGFLGAGIIIKTGERVHGLTTAALVWTVAAVGILAGVGYFQMAIASAVIIPGILYLWRKIGIYERIRPVRIKSEDRLD